MVQSWHDAPPRPKSHRQKSIEPVSIVFVPEDSPFLIGLAGYYPHRSEYWEAEQFSPEKIILPPERAQAMKRLAEFCTADFVKP